MSISNGVYGERIQHKYVFNRHNDDPIFGNRRDYLINRRKTIYVDRILSTKLNENGYYTVVGLSFCSEDMALYKVTIHNTDEFKNILASSKGDELANFKLLYKYGELEDK